MSTIASRMQEELFIAAAANASSANIKAGFDLMAITLEGLEQPLSNVVKIRFSGTPSEIRVEELVDKNVPADWEKNCAARAAISGVMQTDQEYRGLLEANGVHIITETNIPNPAGLGSSGASAAAGMVAARLLLRSRAPARPYMTAKARIEAALVGETARHYDNVSASVLGGLVVNESGEFVRHTVPSWYVLLAKPKGVTKSSTAEGRSLLTVEDRAFYTNDQRAIEMRKIIVKYFESGNIGEFAHYMAGFEDPVERKRAENGFYGPGISPRFLGNLYKSLAHEKMPSWVSGAGPYTLAVAGYSRGKIDVAKSIFTRAYAELGTEPEFIDAILSNRGASEIRVR